MDVNIYGNVYVNFDENEVVERKVSKPQDVRKNASVNTSKKNVKKRDIVCQACGNGDMQLQVHHIQPLAKYPDLASDESNMILLCQSCHMKYHEQFKGSEGGDTFSKWLIDNGRRF